MGNAVFNHENIALCALGGNLTQAGQSPARTLGRAIAMLVESPGIRLLAVSRYWTTPAFPAGSGPDYTNAALTLHTTLAPEALLAVLHGIEADLGRERISGQRWSARPIDIDLIAMGDLVLPDDEEQDRWRGLSPEKQREIAPDRLILPHPRMQDRAFVLAPLAEVAPDWVHPRLKSSVAAMLAALPETERSAVRAFVS
ncbi:2-amino-4-hydroxy-6-hydroxymethyldihydropteridine diphosphokinase [Paracoccus pacificus]|uniref:2-amino-4-hydroxy-6-hydroxymethyldihydropteridine pyrophosphokinase n=1 Tax=Paracoccus pacificus TaxID=1463598 RepID=A0ABW4R877_9RHOB